jgi:hypothetical protein
MQRTAVVAVVVGVMVLGAGCGGGGGDPSDADTGDDDPVADAPVPDAPLPDAPVPDAPPPPDASPPDAVPTGTACDIITQTGCSAGQKCTWIRISTGTSPAQQLGQAGCAPDGTVAANGACQWGPSGATTGFDNCAEGAVCLASPAMESATGTCLSTCSLGSAQLVCPTAYACGQYSKFGSNSPGEQALFGLCDPTCNPLTRQRDYDLAAECGSIDPANPNRGCYGFPSSGPSPSKFTCNGLGTLGHRQIVTPPVFTNSCTSAAIPMLYEQSGSMSIVCIAIGAPLTVNNTQPAANRYGMTPYSCPQVPVLTPMFRATGTGEVMQHWWFWEDATTPQSTASNSYGVCVDFTKYTWDHDQNAATPPVPWSDPTTLVPWTGDPSLVTPQMDLFWGVAPYPSPLVSSVKGHTAADLGFTPLVSPRMAP